MIHLVNSYGRPFGDLDALKGHLTVREMAAQAGCASYSVVAEDGTPIFGFVGAAGGPEACFIASEWNRGASAASGGESITRLCSGPPPCIEWIGIDWASEPDRTATMLVLPKPWLLPDGRPPGDLHIILPAPHPRRVLAISIGHARYHATASEGYRP